MAAKLARREGLESTAFLPPALALAKEVEDLPERLAREVLEHRVREHLEDLNARIVKAIRGPQTGPPMRTQPVDVEATVEAWRTARPVPDPQAAQASEPADPPRRRWWQLTAPVHH